LRADVQGLPDPQFVVALLSDASKDSIFLVLYGLPLLAAVTVVGCSVGFLMQPHRAFAVWGQRAWRVGSIEVVVILLWILLLLMLWAGGLLLLIAVTGVGCMVGFLVPPHRTVGLWGQRARRAGAIALALMLLWSLVVVVGFRGGPSLGFVGLLVGYGLLWTGNRIVLTARP
jgi:hypothetical protein